MVTEKDTLAVWSLQRPHDDLLKYYFIVSLILGPFFFALFIPLFFRFRTLRYRFDEEGVQMRWGLLFRREISLTYSRIQDIHLESNAVERYFGLARVQVQTASGSSKAEMTIEGLKKFEIVRDVLYSRMRGAREPADTISGDVPTPRPGRNRGHVSEAELEALNETLAEVARELRELRRDIARARGAPGPARSTAASEPSAARDSSGTGDAR